MKHKMHTHLLYPLAARILILSTAVGLQLAGPAQGQTCALYPIALSAQTLDGVAPGTVLDDIWNGSNPGNFGWLSWTGDPGETTLVVSLQLPGDSNTYVNPDNAADTKLNVGDWVAGKPGVSNGKYVRAALDALIGVEIIVPVWDQVRGEGNNTAYRVAGFAIVQIISYDLAPQNRIKARFIGFVSCDDAPPV